MHTIVLNLKQLYSLVPFSSSVFLLFLNSNIVLITRSRLSIAQVSSPFKWLDTHSRLVRLRQPHPPYRSAPSCYFTTALLNDCYNEVTANTVLAYSYWASFHDAYICMLMSHPLTIPTTAAI